MNVIKVIPRGFCFGVVQSIKIAKDTVKKYPDRNIYMIGLIVHNKIVVKELEELGIIVLDDWRTPRSELLNNLEKDSVVIFSAHGTAPEVLKIAEKNNLIIVDTKCEWVKATEDLISEHLNKGYEILFLGKHDHPETIALTSLDKKRIHLVTNLSELESLNIDGTKLFATNQTTLSIIDTDIIYRAAKAKYPNIVIKNDICNATQERQEAILKLNSKEIDILFIVGDERSNNTLKLVEIGLKQNIRTIRINSKDDIKVEWLRDLETVAVSAGASTPSIIQNDVIKYLENYKKTG